MIRKSYSPFVLVGIVLILALSACGAPEAAAPTLDMNAAFTMVAGTISAGYTQTALAMPTATNTPEPTVTPLTSPTSPPLDIATATLPVPTITPTVSFLSMYTDPSTANGCYNAALVQDVTVLPGSDYDPGDKFTKTWRLMNTGTCDWTADFKIKYVGGKLFNSDTEKIRQRVPVGSTADISLGMVAPDGSGTVVSNWQMETNEGKLFGPILTISIDLPGNSISGKCYDSALVADVTIPNGTEMEPGDDFIKTWTIKNTGTCKWKEDFRIQYVGGNLFGSDTEKIRRIVREGETTNISLHMTAPKGSGVATSSWQIATESGEAFGQVFTVQIVLK